MTLIASLSFLKQGLEVVMQHRITALTHGVHIGRILQATEPFETVLDATFRFDLHFGGSTFQ